MKRNRLLKVGFLMGLCLLGAVPAYAYNLCITVPTAGDPMSTHQECHDVADTAWVQQLVSQSSGSATGQASACLKQVQDIQSSVATNQQKLETDIQTRISQILTDALAVKDADRPTESQKQLIEAIRQIVREEVRAALQQQQSQ